MIHSENLVRGAGLLVLVSLCWFVAPDRLRALFVPSVLAAATTFTVNTADDVDDNTCDLAHCSLREAINAANANAGTDTINFNIPGPGVHTIAPTTKLPDINEEVTIDGYSQPGASANTLGVGDNAVLLIELNGAGAGVSSGLRLQVESTVKGLVINRFSQAGIDLLSDGIVIEGNFIGTDPFGTSGPGCDIGVRAFFKNNTIGGTTPASRNIISGNKDAGVFLSGIAATGNKVQNNYIGTIRSGTLPLGNGTGVRIAGAVANTIGGLSASMRNIIAFNAKEGISIVLDDAVANTIIGNSIHSNGGLGIDISPFDVNLNDTNDSDTGPNGLQNFPVITANEGGGFVTVQGTLDSADASLPVRIEVFSNRSCDPSGHGEGERLSASGLTMTNGAGDASFFIQFPAGVLIGPYLTATAASFAGSTSEFSQCVPASATILQVNKTADTNDGSCSAVDCSLREAIASANLSSTLDQINFNIPGAGVHTINLLSPLPALTEPVFIDGYSQPGASPNTLATGTNAVIKIEINGAGAGNTDGLRLAGGSSVVRGLAINRFQRAAIKLETNGFSVVAGNFLGTDTNGDAALGNGLGVSVGAPDNRVGGLQRADRNVISGNTDDGIFISGGSANRTLVQGNYVGVSSSGSQALGNGQRGVVIENGAGAIIGGNFQAASNVISGNGNAGIEINNIEASRVLGNLIGTPASTFGALGNGAEGVRVSNSLGIVIGGPAGSDANVIAANGEAGIQVHSSANVHIQKNFIGTNSSGFAGLGNSGAGVQVLASTAIQITTNTIVNNGGLGIDLFPEGVTPNDAGDADTGPNNLQNFPVLTSAIRSNTNVDILGALDSTPNTQFRIEYFISSGCDPSGHGEGRRLAGTDNLTTDATGHASISELVSSSSIEDQVITAVATDPFGNTSEFSACVPILEMAPSPSPTPTPSPAASSLQFGEAIYNVTEDCTEVIVSVSRTGDTSQTASVDYSTLNGTASDRSDFNTALGTLNFAPGETAVSFIVLINEDSLVEGTEIASLVLSNPSGAMLGSQSSALLEIFDDPPEPAANAIDVAEQFVAQHYHDFLNRQHDVSGLNFWTNQIESCGSDLVCIQMKRVNVSAAFFLSIEFQETGFFVIRTQRTAFGRKSDNAGTRLTYLQFLRQARQVGGGLIVGAPGWQQKLEANRQAYAAQTAASAEFITMYPLTMTAAEYVDALFTSAGVVPTSAERQDALDAFGASGRVAALRKVIDSPSLRDAEMRPAFVLMQYFGYLRRNPTDAPDADDGGYQFWLAKLNQFNGDFVAAEMVRAFLVSSEYRQRFGHP